MTLRTPEQIGADFERYAQVAGAIWNGVWCVYLIGLALLAYLSRDNLNWETVKWGGVITGGFLIAMILATVIVAGALYAWQTALVFGMFGGFAAQEWGCLIGICIASFIGLIRLFQDTSPLREARRRTPTSSAI